MIKLFIFLSRLNFIPNNKQINERIKLIEIITTTNSAHTT